VLQVGLILAGFDPDAGPGEPRLNTIEAGRDFVDRGGVSGAGLDGRDAIDKRLKIG
jgi:hypothetical protein